MITARAFAGRHYAVYGLARSGIAAAQSLLASGAQVTAWDENAKAREELCSRVGASPGLGLCLRRDTDWDLSEFDSLVMSPGVPLNRHPLGGCARAANLEIIGDIELFARARSELPPHKLVGITGTNGKSTTTALVHHILKTAGVPTTMGGNIGLPILAQDPLTPNDNGLGVYVLELSSYQIDLTKSLDCDVAVLLNITPDHLDRYDSFEAYAASKARLFEMQSGEHTAFIVVDDVEATKVLERLSARESLGYADGFPTSRLGPVYVGTLLEDGLDQAGWPALQGPHNAQNAAAAFETCLNLEVNLETIEEGLRTFPGLSHRMERVREKDGVLFVNDSKATNPTATAPALAAFPAIRWILGGQAKADTLDECKPHFGNVRSAYTIGEAAELFERLLRPHMPVENCGELAMAVTRAAEDAQAGDTVLLSPACASFDQFRDFEDRGDRFKDLVGAL